MIPRMVVVGLLVFVVAVLMTMVGKGGGNFYVVILALAGVPMHQAATTGQFILFAAAVAAMLVFHKNKSVLWPLAVLIGGVAAVAALAGGYFSHLFSGFVLKLIFAGMLVVAGAVMLVPVAERNDGDGRSKLGWLRLKAGGQSYLINLWVAVPVTILTGFAAGMVGVSGGSFLVPLMVLACGVSMQAAVGTASTLIAATAAMGFAGHAAQGDFNAAVAVPLAVVTIAGGLIGGTMALKAKPKHLKRLFAYTNWVVALLMLFNALHSRGLI